MSFSIVSFGIYCSVLIPPALWWPAGFIACLIPFVLIANIGLLLFHLMRGNHVISLILAVTVAAGLPFLRSNLALNIPTKASYTDNLFKVLSYNVHNFSLKKEYGRHQFSKKMISWSLNDDAGIKCFQEFFSSNKQDSTNIVALFSNAGYFHSIKNFSPGFDKVHGLAIFSKYPILYQGTIFGDNKTHNGAIFIDVRIGQKTLRIYNVHLQSMGLKTDNLVNGAGEKGRKTFVKSLKTGFILRSNQVDRITQHINDSPHPVILCGDLNDVPFSYTYFQLRYYLKNAFESSGNGIQYTFNGQIPLLRIDNQFYDKSIRSYNFRTMYEISISDHFPIKSCYSLH